MASAHEARRTWATLTVGWPLLANQTTRKTACPISDIPSASVTRGGHVPEPSEGLTTWVETYTPAAKAAIETKIATPPGACEAPATRSPRNAMFPVIKAE